MAALKSFAILSFLHLIAASPAPGPARVLDAEHALITPSPVFDPATNAYLQRRGIISDITSDLESDVNSILSGLGSDIPSYVASGVPNYFQGFPIGSDVLSSASVTDTDLSATPTQVLNIPGYGNWTSSGWNLRVHGNVYKQPNISNDTANDLTNKFLIDTSVEQLPQTQADQAVNLTRSIFVVQQADVNVTVNINPAPSAGSSGQEGGGGGITPPGGEQTLTLPYATSDEGDFDAFVPLQNVSGGLLPGDGQVAPQRINVYANGTLTGNATSYLVSTEGFTVVSDIDDILRVTKIYEPKQGLLNSFALPFTPWLNMPSIYANWSTSLPLMHFHYLTTTPEQITRTYEQFIFETYPGGSFDDRPLNFSDVAATLSIRKFLLDKIFQTFPQRKFILIADTSNSDVMRDYPAMATDYPGQVQCIFLRNTSSTDPGDRFPYDTSGFKDLNQQMYMFFNVPDDLTNLDIVNGQCYNSTIPQNLTFGYQGLPLGINLGGGNKSSAASPQINARTSWGSGVVSGILAVLGAAAFSGL